jgi:nucleolar protein 6
MKRGVQFVNGVKSENRSQPKKKQKSKQFFQSGGKHTLFVGQLPFDCTKEILIQHFGAYSLRDVKLMTDKKTGKFRGIAFLELGDEKSMQLALKKNGSKIGQLLSTYMAGTNLCVMLRVTQAVEKSMWSKKEGALEAETKATGREKERGVGATGRGKGGKVLASVAKAARARARAAGIQTSYRMFTGTDLTTFLQPHPQLCLQSQWQRGFPSRSWVRPCPRDMVPSCLLIWMVLIGKK